MVSDDDNRRTPRLEILGDLLGEVMIYQSMIVTDVSRAGVQIETPFPLQIDSLHELRLRLGSRSVVVKGRVVHSHACDMEEGRAIYRAGIEFVEPSERVVQAVAEFMGAIVAGRPEPTADRKG